MSSEKQVAPDFELENAYLKAENSALKAELAILNEKLTLIEAEPEYSDAFDETVIKSGFHK